MVGEILKSLTRKWATGGFFGEISQDNSTERLTQSVIHCYNCGLTYNADFNAAINIGSSILAEPRSQEVQLNHPELRMNQPERLGSAEATGL